MKKYTQSELNQFISLINKKKLAAEEILASLKESLRNDDNGGNDTDCTHANFMEDAFDSSNKEELNILAHHQQKLITEYVLALERIRNGVYGVCIETGEMIPVERLNAYPCATHLVRR